MKNRKKVKRIAAIVVVILLIAMYVSTLVFALLDFPLANDLLKASVGATILIPVLLYGLLLATKLINGDGDDENKIS